METVEISPVPGLIKATPDTRPSAAWTKWLEAWRAGEPDTRSPYWPIWSRHQSREVLRTAYTERPHRRNEVFDKMTPSQFALAKLRLRINEFVQKRGQLFPGVTISAEMKRDLVGAVLVRLFASGLDCSRTHGEISVYVDRFVNQLAGRALADLLSPVHVTDWGYKKGYRPNLVPEREFLAVCAGLSALNLVILKESLSGMTDQALGATMRRNKI